MTYYRELSNEEGSSLCRHYLEPLMSRLFRASGFMNHAARSLLAPIRRGMRHPVQTLAPRLAESLSPKVEKI